MLELNPKRNIKVKRGIKLNDSSLIFGCVTSPVWGLLFTNFGKAALLLLKQFFRANSVISAYMLTVKNRNVGILSCGMALTVVGTFIMVVYNSSFTWSFFSALKSFSWPQLPYWQNCSWQEIAYDVLYANVISFPLLVYTGLFFVCSSWHTLKNWFGYGTNDIASRGTSYLYSILKFCFSKWIGVGEFFVNLVEAVLVMVVAAALIHYEWDAHFGYLLFSMGFHEMIILVIGKATEIHSRPILRI